MIVKRECYKCGQLIFYDPFMFMNSRFEKMLDPILLHQIWINPMFLLECCWCFGGRTSPMAFMKELKRKGYKII